KDKKYEKDAEELVNHAFGAEIFERSDTSEVAKVVRKWEDQPALVKKNIAGSLEDKTKKVKKARKKSAEVGGGENIKKKGEKNMSMEKPKSEEETKDRVTEDAKERQKVIDKEWSKEEVITGDDFSAEEAQAELYEQKKRGREGVAGVEGETGGEKEKEKIEVVAGAEKKEKTVAEVLEAAREGFVRAEKNYEKYKMLTGDISKIFKKGERVAVKEEYEKAKKEYESARAEHVADHLNVYVDERMKIADERAEKFEKGKWKKTWDWMGKQNLEKLGWKPEGKIGKFLAKGLNLRTAVSLGLLGTGIGFGMGSAIGLSALIAKRIYGVAATATGSYELLRMGTERLPRLTEKKFKSLDLGSAEELMVKYEIRMALKGQKPSENENYQKLRKRYLEIAGGADKKVEELMKSADEKLEKMSKKLKRGDIYRKIIAVGAGAVIGGSGLNKLMEQMNGGPVGDLSKAAEAVAGTKEMPDQFSGVVQANEGYIHESRKALAMYIHEFGDEKLQNLTPAQKIWAEDKLWDMYREAHPGAEKAILKVGDKVAFSTENIKQVLGEVQEKFGAPEKIAQLSKNLEYSDNVDWGRYSVVKHPQMGEVYGWQMDEGVKAVHSAEGIAKGLVSERLGMAQELFENATYREVYDRFNLSPDDYSAIKDIPTGKFLNEFSYWNAPKDMISGEVDHLELWRKLKIKDLVIENGPSAEELKMPLHEYLKQHWFGKALEDISKTKAGI
ncbi:hypothetical protein KJ695_05230, partial [Patescibacteria group bacterium]|nr:hypothetical protein [Patescibacteria group bacterium]